MNRKMTTALACALLVLSASAQQETTRLRTITGSLMNSYMGTSVANAGDVNRDGIDDVIVGAPFHDGPNGVDAGVVLVYDGRSGQILHNLDGPFAGRRYGTSVASAGDVNGDGYDDLIIGGYGGGQGVVRVVSGDSGGTLVTLTDAAGWGLGFSVACAGDVDGDGTDDVVVGLPYYDIVGSSNVGQVRVYSIGPFTQEASFTGTWANQYLGWSVACAGDVDGDNRADVVAGAPFYNPGFPNANMGRVEVFSPWQGSGSAPLVDFVPNIGEIGNHANAGYSVTGIGDVNGDGVPDVACGAPSYERNSSNITNGRVYAISGVHVPMQSATVLWTADASTSSAERLGFRVCALGDPCGDLPLDVIASSPNFTVGGDDLGKISRFAASSGLRLDFHSGYDDAADFGDGLCAGGDHNGDGVADYIVGAPDFDNTQSFFGTINSGRVYIFSGAPELRSHSNAAGFQVDPGHRVGVVGDVNGDGFDEYVIGNHDPGGSGSFNGQASVYDGRTGGLLYSLSDPASAPNKFGFDVAGAGDFNGDGTPDIIVGAPDYAPRGAAFIYSGTNGSLITTLLGGVGAGDFGAAVDGAGDVNGDGRDDVVIGDPFHLIGAGRVAIYSGATFGLIGNVIGSSAERLGTDVAGLGDLDADGFADVAAGAPDASLNNPNDDAGALRVYIGSGAGIFPAYSVLGTVGERCGTSVASAGDVNGDGLPDIVVGGPNYSSMPLLGSDVLLRGRVRVIDGISGSVIATRLGDEAGDRMGISVSGAGDFDGDGRCDFIGGAPFADRQGIDDIGYAVVWSMSAELMRFEGSNRINSLGNGGSQMGRSVAGGARISADCLSDVLVSSSREYFPGTGFKTLIYGRGDFPGLDHYGVGTPACDGPVCLTGNGRPNVGNDDFELRCLNAEPMSTGDLLLTTDGFQSPAGLDPTGLGILLHVDWLTAPPLGTLQFTCDNAGFAAFPAQIPNIPSIAGFVLSFQAILYTQSACPGPVFGYSTTNGLDMIIQP